MSADGVVNLSDVPTEEAIFGWISEVFDQGIRWPAIRRTSERKGGSPTSSAASGSATSGLNPPPSRAGSPPTGRSRSSAPTAGPRRSIASPCRSLRRSTAPSTSCRSALSSKRSWSPSIEAGAAAFIGTLTDYPGNSFNYFVPYDAIARPIPGVWVNGTDGAWLRDQLARGPVRVRLTVASEREDVESHNVVGELEGADEETVMIGSHHDGPWASAVEDGSGISLVLAQATYWAAQPVERRPHRLVFVLQGGHMSGGAGLRGYIEAHRAELAQVVLEVHLEHAALEFAVRGGDVVPTGEPVPRWFFTSRNPSLESAVAEALEAEQLGRSMILAPDAFGEQPRTDGAFYHREGVPVMNFLTAPFYLFDAMDTLDKIDRENLVPLPRPRSASSSPPVGLPPPRSGQRWWISLAARRDHGPTLRP
ncbi:MAG: M28 family metallopeptidase [Acidimicrobiales bacterium]